MNEIALKAREYPHTEVGLEQMALAILGLGEDTRVIMEATGRYHEPVATALHEYGIRVTVINPLFIKQSGGSIRKWVDFIMTFWHCECIALISETAYTERYRKWCKRKGYHFSASKAADLHIDSIGQAHFQEQSNHQAGFAPLAQDALPNRLRLFAQGPR